MIEDVVMWVGFAAVLVWSLVMGLVCLCLALAAVRTLLEQIKSLTIRRRRKAMAGQAKNTKSHERGLSGSEQREVFIGEASRQAAKPQRLTFTERFRIGNELDELVIGRRICRSLVSRCGMNYLAALNDAGYSVQKFQGLEKGNLGKIIKGQNHGSE